MGYLRGMPTVPRAERPYLLTLRHLNARGVEFVVIGSFGLRLHLGDRLEEIAGRPPADCDIVLPRAALVGLVDALAEDGWRVWSGDDDVSAGLPAPGVSLDGRQHLLANRDELILDATYEPAAGWPELSVDALVVDGVAVASLDHIAAIMAARGTDRDQAVIERLRSLG